MPIIKSAKKALKQSRVRHERNLETKAKYKKAVRTVTTETLPLAQKAIDKAAKNNLISKNRAARLKSRIVKTLKSDASDEKPKQTVKKTATKKTKKTSK